MRTIQGSEVVRVTVEYDEEKRAVHFLVTGPRGGTRAGFIVRLRDLFDELHRLGIWIGIPNVEVVKIAVEKCEWTWGSSEYYETGCDKAFLFFDGGPSENNFEFCPYCGRELVIVSDWTQTSE